MLLKYLRDSDRRKIGVVVALDKKHIGWSILHDKDMQYRAPNGNYKLFDAEKGIGSAIRKAERGYDYWVEDFNQKICSRFEEGINPELVVRAFPKMVYVMSEMTEMKRRVMKYFKENQNDN